MRKTWKIINNQRGKLNDKTSIPTIFMENNDEITEPKQIADGFCKFFANIGKKYSENIADGQKNFKDYLGSSSNKHSIFLTPTDPNEVSKILNKSKAKTSCGHDNLSMMFIKNISSAICHPLSVIINKSMQSGIVPDCMKLAKVIPIHKSKNKDVFDNYRPISLLPTISKILERVMHNRIYNFLKSNDILYAKQFDFRPKHSTIDAIINLVKDIIENYEKKQITESVFRPI